MKLAKINALQRV